MTTTTADTLSVVVEREFAFPVDRVWRALTQPHLIAEWLMENDFEPEVGRPFRFTADWGGVDCEVLSLEPMKSLAYSWGAMGQGTTVTWTLTPGDAGTHVRMEQEGFRKEASQMRFFHGARMGWQGFFEKLGDVLARID